MNQFGRWSSALLFISVLFGISLHAAARSEGQTSEAPQFRTTHKEQRISPAEMVRRFEADDPVDYELGEGDEITIETWGRPELSGKHTIGPDGKITLPLVGATLVSGLTREKAADAVAKALKAYYTDLAITVRVDQYTSSRVFILGRVTTAGVIHFDNPPTLLEAITRAGSLPVGAGAEKTALNRCAVFRGRNRVIWIDLKSLLTEGNLALNLRLRRNDIVYIPDADDQLVYVLGEVSRPGAYRLTPEMSFLDAFTQAGGATHDGAANRIQLIRARNGQNRQVALNGFTAPELHIALEDGDILYVPPRRLAQAGYVFEKLSPMTGYVLLGSTMAK